MKLNIAPTSRLSGIIRAPASKSYSHRAFIAAALSTGVSIIKNPLTTGDVAVTINLLRKIGVRILKKDDNSYVISKETESFLPYKNVLDCKNSGTTIRFLSALSLIIDEGLILTGTFLKKQRPIVPLLEALTNLGASYKLTKNEIHIKRVTDQCNKIQIVGNVSSQFISALLMVCPVLDCENDCFIHIKSTTPLVSYPYLEITKNVLDSFEISIQEIMQPDNTIQYTIRCAQNYRPQVYDVPGDFSSAAFIIAAVVLTKKDSKVTIQNLNFRKPQADKKLLEILKTMGAKIDIDKNNNQLTVYGNLLEHPLIGNDIDCQNFPDLFPILSVIGVFAEGKTTLYNASHLRYKESDRIAIISRELQKLGVKVDETTDTLTVYHTKNLRGSNINHENDHRIAMALTILCLFAESSSKMSNIEIINDSYPDFLSHLEQIGANIKINNEQNG
ncbi:MAG: 3-phosphoshikimate 1-carboxyvinyltransferase [Candidatus Lokiarchaeota archaeon]|jgi:3-phosphoshikimate 1-carboxyvinyltransferase